MHYRSWRSITAALGALGLLLVAASAKADEKGPDAAGLAGLYRANAMEIGGGLMLGADGTFEYGLSYGAIDETGSGTWRREDDTVLLTSRPEVKKAELNLVSNRELPRGLTVTLALPEGLSRQYFSLLLTYADGHDNEVQLGEQGLTLDDFGEERPVNARLILPLYSLASEAVPIPPAKGMALSFRFVPNDLGKADFRDQPLKIEDGKLILIRFSRRIEFVPGN